MPWFQPFMFGDKQGGGMRPAPPSAARSAAAWAMWVKFGGWRVGRPERRDDSDDTGETGRTEWTNARQPAHRLASRMHGLYPAAASLPAAAVQG